MIFVVNYDYAIYVVVIMYFINLEQFCTSAGLGTSELWSCSLWEQVNNCGFECSSENDVATKTSFGFKPRWSPKFSFHNAMTVQLARGPMKLNKLCCIIDQQTLITVSLILFILHFMFDVLVSISRSIRRTQLVSCYRCSLYFILLLMFGCW